MNPKQNKKSCLGSLLNQLTNWRPMFISYENQIKKVAGFYMIGMLVINVSTM